MKSIIYAFLFLTLPISMAGKDSTTTKSSNTAVMQAAKHEEIKTPPAPSIVKHDTVYVAVKEMPGDNSSLWISIVTVFLTFTAIGTTIWSARKSFKFSSDTLKEMKEQRLAAYKPELVIPRFRVIIDDLDDGICYSRNKEYNKLNDKPISLDIVNLGQGVAKNINIEYKINRNCFLAIHNKLKNEGMTDGIQFYEKGSELLEGIFEENKDRDILILNNGYDTLIFDEMISFLLPISKSPDNSTYSIFIKNYYIELYLIYIKEKELFKDLEFPAIEVRLEYCDLIYNSKPYIHNYIVKPILVYEYHHEYLYSVFVWIEPKKLE